MDVKIVICILLVLIQLLQFSTSNPDVDKKDGNNTAMPEPALKTNDLKDGADKPAHNVFRKPPAARPINPSRPGGTDREGDVDKRPGKVPGTKPDNTPSRPGTDNKPDSKPGPTPSWPEQDKPILKPGAGANPDAGNKVGKEPYECDKRSNQTDHGTNNCYCTYNSCCSNDAFHAYFYKAFVGLLIIPLFF